MLSTVSMGLNKKLMEAWASSWSQDGKTIAEPWPISSIFAQLSCCFDKVVGFAISVCSAGFGSGVRRLVMG